MALPDYIDYLSGSKVSTTGPSTDEGAGFASSIGDLLLGYATNRAALDLQSRADQINTPDRVDVATQTQAGQQAAVAGIASSPLGNPWVIAAIVGAGVVGAVLVVKAL